MANIKNNDFLQNKDFLKIKESLRYKSGSVVERVDKLVKYINEYIKMKINEKLITTEKWRVD